MIRDDLAALNVKHDVFFSERSLIEGGDQVGATIEALRAEGQVYEGRLPPPKGAPVEDYEDREQTLFRATDVRRRRRPAAEEIRRQLHLFRLRHRLSQVEVRPRLHAT